MTLAERLQKIAENVPKVFDAGKYQAWSDYQDNYQQNGTRTAYPYAYAYANDEVFKPKYNLICSGYYGAQGVFAYSTITDVAKILNDRGILIDTSGAQIFSDFCRSSKTISSPPLDLTSATNVSLAFYDATNLRDVTLLNIHADLKFDRTFGYSPKIENVVVTGTIGQDIDFQYATYLSKASITNIIEHLSTTSSGKTLTLSKKAVNTAFATSYGGADGSTSEEWIALVNSRTNWTISLI